MKAAPGRRTVRVTCRDCKQECFITPAKFASRKYQCHPCESKYLSERRQRLKAEGRPIKHDPTKRAEYEAQRREAPQYRARTAAAMRRYQHDPKLRPRHEARWQARRAIANGSLSKQSCEKCGALDVHAHHDDYTKPLDVRWLCPPCHREWHEHNEPIYPDAPFTAAQQESQP